jgi:hypothetical protein
MAGFRLTETLLARDVTRNTLERAKLIAYDMVIRMVHDNTQLGREIRRVRQWDGKRSLRIRYGDNFVNMEPIV